MPTITLTFSIKAPISRCFNLARSIDLHQISTQATGEKAIAGTTSGLIGRGQTVTWRAKHLGVWQTLTSKITAFDPPFFFVDEMVAGAFASFYHEHSFEENDGYTLMRDTFRYQSPFGVLGRLADKLFLERYMRKLLLERNLVIKQYAETDLWKQVL